MSTQLRMIMGESMMDAEEVAQLFGLNVPDQDMCRFGDVLFSGQTLKSCAKDSGFELLPVFALSILFLSSHYPQLFFAREQNAWWKQGMGFACETGCENEWHLIRNDRLHGLPGLVDLRQANFQVPFADEQLPSSRVLVYKAIINFLARGERWLAGFYAPSSDKVNGRRVCVGYNDSGGLDIVLERDHMRCYVFGLVTEKKNLATLAAEAKEKVDIRS